MRERQDMTGGGVAVERFLFRTIGACTLLNLTNLQLCLQTISASMKIHTNKTRQIFKEPIFTAVEKEKSNLRFNKHLSARSLSIGERYRDNELSAMLVKVKKTKKNALYVP